MVAERESRHFTHRLIAAAPERNKTEQEGIALFDHGRYVNVMSGYLALLFMFENETGMR